jgi:hypothetical protein
MKFNKRNMFLAVTASSLLGSTSLMAITISGDTVTPTGTEVNVAGDANVEGTLTVQAPPSPVTVNANGNNFGQQNAVPDSDNGSSTAFRTTLGGTTADYTTATGGGAEIKNNGDTTLNAATGTQNTVTVSRVTEVRLYNADQGVLAGQPVAASQSYYLVDGNGLEIPGSRVNVGDPGIPDATAAQAAFEELVDGDGIGDIDFTGPSFASATASSPLAATGGNLSVGGDANIAGSTTTNGIDNSGEKITGVADGTDPNDAVNKGQLDAETAARIADVDAEEARALAAEEVLDDKIDQEVQDRIADVNAEEAARIADVNAEEARALLAENVLQGNINLEAAARASEDTVLHNRINQEQSIRAAEDASIRNEFRAADQKLGDRISTNTRGIAMVAAMTNTTVQPGMKQAVDFNVAQFEGETGFAFGYSYRVNENLQIQGAGATTTDVEESVVRLGMSYQW